MKPEEQRNDLLAGRLIKQLEQRHYNAMYCKTAQEAVKTIVGLIPDGSSVAWGGSMTIRDMGLTKALHDRASLEIWDRDLAPARDAAQAIYRKTFSADYYLSSVNAISESGEIVNIDGNGNRVAAITFGPKHVILVVGLNKVAKDLDAAMARARGTAAPINAQRFADLNTSCRTDGVCHDCKSPDCLCNYIEIMRNSRPAGRHTVVLVGENLGF